MAHFYGGVQGNRGEATRLGSKQSGLSMFAYGWDSGVDVRAFVNRDGRDCFSIFLTAGSGGGMNDISLGTYYRDEEDNAQFIVPDRTEERLHFLRTT